ncbi:MAG: hypothetical protein RLY78_2147 [Pseudomonadota bacterium]
MSPATPRTLVLVAHPALQHSRVTRALMSAADGLEGVALRDLYACYPDYAIDVAAEQAAALAADHLVWLHPFHWYGMPPLMKLWLDEVLVQGWAHGGTPDGPTRALAGKSLWLVTSTGGPAASYGPDGHHGHDFSAFLPPYAQTAALCGLRFRPPLVLHGAHQVSAAARQAHVARWLAGLRGDDAAVAALASTGADR